MISSTDFTTTWRKVSEREDKVNDGENWYEELCGCANKTLWATYQPAQMDCDPEPIHQNCRETRIQSTINEHQFHVPTKVLFVPAGTTLPPEQPTNKTTVVMALQ